jgi:RNA-binding protein
MLLRGYQKKYLRGLAHKIKPVVFVGHKGITDAVTQSAEEALENHELIKLKFVEFKEKARKQDMAAALEEKTGSEMVGMIGHTAIFFRPHSDPEKRKIRVPERGP